MISNRFPIDGVTAMPIKRHGGRPKAPGAIAVAATSRVPRSWAQLRDEVGATGPPAGRSVSCGRCESTWRSPPARHALSTRSRRMAIPCRRDLAARFARMVPEPPSRRDHSPLVRMASTLRLKSIPRLSRHRAGRRPPAIRWHSDRSTDHCRGGQPSPARYRVPRNPPVLERWDS